MLIGILARVRTETNWLNYFITIICIVLLFQLVILHFLSIIIVIYTLCNFIFTKV
jgi:hypothetical protein